jgi:hypothetical protein
LRLALVAALALATGCPYQQPTCDASSPTSTIALPRDADGGMPSCQSLCNQQLAGVLGYHEVTACSFRSGRPDQWVVDCQLPVLCD